MKITVWTAFDPNKIELDTQSATFGVLLDELSVIHPVTTAQFFDSAAREIYPDCEVLINKHTPADGLNTKLQDGDTVEVFLVTPGGG